MRLVLPALAVMLMGSATLATAQLGGAPLPVQSPGTPDLVQRELERAFDALRTAPDEAGGRMAEAAVRQLWSRRATPAVALLLNRGIRTLRGGQAADALEDFDAAILLEPGLADAWHWRAQAHAAAGDARGAATDLRESLRLEPRHFAALVTLSRLQEEARDAPGALRSFRAALEIHPQLPGGTARLRELTRLAEGEAM